MTNAPPSGSLLVDRGWANLVDRHIHDALYELDWARNMAQGKSERAKREDRRDFYDWLVLRIGRARSDLEELRAELENAQ